MAAVPLKPQSAVRQLDIDGQVTLFDPETQTALVLNHTASDVWRLLDGQRTTDQIVTMLSAAYQADPDTVREGVEAALDQLRDHQLVAPES